MAKWNDFNNLEEQSSDYGVIPNGTIAKVRMTIKPGGYNDESQNWTGGYATKNPETGSISLNAEFTVLEGQYAKRKVWGKIGLHSENGPEWPIMGRQLVRSMLNSARGISAKDTSEKAVAARQVKSFADLDGIEFIAKIGTYVNQYGEQKNELKAVITPDHKDYATVKNANASQTQHQHTQPTNNNSNRSNWA